MIVLIRKYCCQGRGIFNEAKQIVAHVAENSQAIGCKFNVALNPIIKPVSARHVSPKQINSRHDQFIIDTFDFVATSSKTLKEACDI